MRSVTATLLAVSLLGGCAAGSERTALEGAPPPSHPHLILLLADECGLDVRRQALRLPDDSHFVPPLAFDIELRAMVPELAARKRSDLSEDEARLASYVLLLTPSAEDTAAAQRHALSWPCVKEARESPRVALP